MTVPEYVRRNGAPQQLPTHQICKRVVSQAMRHTRRLKDNDLFSISRPSESEEIKEYREKISRWLTHEGVMKFTSKVSRIFRSVSVISETGMSEDLTAYLNENPFFFAGRQYGIEDFFFQCVMQSAVEDPNAVLIAMPYNKEHPEINPSAAIEDGGVPANKAIDIDARIIASDLLRVDERDVIAWVGGQVMLEDDKKYDWFYMADPMDFWVLMPVRLEEDENGKEHPVYELLHWYHHGSEIRPGVKMPGIVSTSESNEKYHESFLQIYYEYADEFVIAFSDSQAVRVQHAYPKAVMSEIPCPENACNNGEVYFTDSSGVENVRKCKTCGGLGMIKNPGPYNTLVRRKERGETTTPPVLEYISPDPAMLKYGHEVSFEILKRGKKAIGLDLLEDVQESGVAKEHRLEDLQDFLLMIGIGFNQAIEMFLWQLESLLVIDSNKRIYPVVKRPEQYTVKTSGMLLEDAKAPLPSDRIQKSMTYYNVAYRGNDSLIRIYELCHAYSPLFGLSGADLNIRMASGYTEQDLVKADRAFWAFQKIAEKHENALLVKSDEELFKLADEIIEPFLPAPELQLVEGDV